MKYDKIEGKNKPFVLKIRITEMEKNDLDRQAFNHECTITELVRKRLFKKEQLVKK
jgi:hypothetical protein